MTTDTTNERPVLEMFEGRYPDSIYGEWQHRDKDLEGPIIGNVTGSMPTATVAKEFTFVYASENLNRTDPEAAAEVVAEEGKGKDLNRAGRMSMALMLDGDREPKPGPDFTQEDMRRIKAEVNWALDLLFGGLTAKTPSVEEQNAG